MSGARSWHALALGVLAAGLLGCAGPSPRYEGPSRGLRGCVQAAARSLTRDGLTAPALVPASGLRVLVRRGEAVVGEGVTDGSGCFDLAITPGTGALRAELIAMARSPDGSRWVLGVGSQDDFHPLAPSASWQWTSDGEAACGAPPIEITYDEGETAQVGAWTVTEACGSGAITVFARAREAMGLLDPTLSPVEGAALPSLGVEWSPGIFGYCSACFLGGPGDGITIDGEAYASVLRLSGRDDTPAHWSRSVVAHEVGHWAKRAYSMTRSAQGSHSFTTPTAPDLALEEGWATAFGQRVVGASEGDPFDPLYLAMHSDHVDWVDLRSLATSYGPIALPAPASGAAQPLNEFVVAAALWALWMPDGSLATPSLGLGEAGMRTLLASERLRSTLDRGAPGLDLMDLLDAAACSGLATSEAIAQAVAPLRIPWDAAPLCP